MSKTFLSENELMQKCSCGFSILSFPNTLHLKDVSWSLKLVLRDLKDDNKYHAEFQGYTKGTLKYELSFVCIDTPEKHICNVTNLIDKTENTNLNHNV